MDINFYTQPDFQFGKYIFSLLETKPYPKKVIFVSAFVSFQTIMRLKEIILFLHSIETKINFIIGIDLNGTSIEVLQELTKWNINVKIVKNKIPGHTFHPKIFIFEWDSIANIFIGSNNLTEGGFFRNYECCSCTKYNLLKDKEIYLNALNELSKFINPSGPTVKDLDSNILRILIKRNVIPSESKSFTRIENKKNKKISLKNVPP